MEDLLFAFLEHGFLIQLNYVSAKDNQEKYALLMKGCWHNKLIGLKHYENKDIVWDVLRDIPFSLKDKLIKEIVYVSWPEKAEYEKIVSDPKNKEKIDFYNDEEFIDKINLTILEHKLALQNYLQKNCLESFDSYNLEELQDRCSLVFYPKPVKINRDSFVDLKESTMERFFTFASQETPEINQYPALRMFGVKQTYIDETDEQLLAPFKRQWCRLIEREKQAFLDHVTNIDLTDFTEQEKLEFHEEAGSLKQDLNDNIEESINKAKTLKEVISFWPEILQPIPSYVNNS